MRMPGHIWTGLCVRAWPNLPAAGQLRSSLAKHIPVWAERGRMWLIALTPSGPDLSKFGHIEQKLNQLAPELDQWVTRESHTFPSGATPGLQLYKIVGFTASAACGHWAGQLVGNISLFDGRPTAEAP